MADFQADWGFASNEPGVPPRAGVQHPSPDCSVLLCCVFCDVGRRTAQWPRGMLRGTPIYLRRYLHHERSSMSCHNRPSSYPTNILTLRSYLAPPSLVGARLDRCSTREQAHDARLFADQLILCHGLGSDVRLGRVPLDVCCLAILRGDDRRLVHCCCGDNGSRRHMPVQLQERYVLLRFLIP